MQAKIPVIQFREQRGSLRDSMATRVELAGRKELVLHIRKLLSDRMIDEEEIEIKPYAYDSRTGWETYLVSVRDYGVVGFSDGYG